MKNSSHRDEYPAMQSNGPLPQVDNSGDKLDQCKSFKVVCGPCKYINPHSIFSHLHAIACYHAAFNSGFLYAWTCLAHEYALMSSLFLSLNNCLVSE